MWSDQDLVANYETDVFTPHEKHVSYTGVWGEFYTCLKELVNNIVISCHFILNLLIRKSTEYIYFGISHTDDFYITREGSVHLPYQNTFIVSRMT